MKVIMAKYNVEGNRMWLGPVSRLNLSIWRGIMKSSGPSNMVRYKMGKGTKSFSRLTSGVEISVYSKALRSFEFSIQSKSKDDGYVSGSRFGAICHPSMQSHRKGDQQSH